MARTRTLLMAVEHGRHTKFFNTFKLNPSAKRLDDFADIVRKAIVFAMEKRHKELTGKDSVLFGEEKGKVELCQIDIETTNKNFFAALKEKVKEKDGEELASYVDVIQDLERELIEKMKDYEACVSLFSQRTKLKK